VKKTAKITLKAINKILNIGLVVLTVILAMILLVFVSLVVILFTGEAEFNTVVTEIYNGCYIEDLDDDMQSIYYYPDADESKDKVYIVDEWENIIKYASDGKDTVAFHCIYNQYEDNEKDLFVVFNTTTKKENKFKNQKAFLDFCEEQKIQLSDWEMGGGTDYEIIRLGNGWSIYDSPNPGIDKIMNGPAIVYEGFVADVEKKGNNEVEFIFGVPEWIENEIPESNKNLNISETVIGEYKFPPGVKHEVTYYEKLSLNTKTGEIAVID
jgi:hypothetical protein